MAADGELFLKPQKAVHLPSPFFWLCSLYVQRFTNCCSARLEKCSSPWCYTHASTQCVTLACSGVVIPHVSLQILTAACCLSGRNCGTQCPTVVRSVSQWTPCSSITKSGVEPRGSGRVNHLNVLLHYCQYYLLWWRIGCSNSKRSNQKLLRLVQSMRTHEKLLLTSTRPLLSSHPLQLLFLSSQLAQPLP